MEHEIVAVVAKRNDDPGKIEVIATIDESRAPINSASSLPPNLLGYL